MSNKTGWFDLKQPQDKKNINNGQTANPSNAGSRSSEVQPGCRIMDEVVPETKARNSAQTVWPTNLLQNMCHECPSLSMRTAAPTTRSAYVCFRHRKSIWSERTKVPTQRPPCKVPLYALLTLSGPANLETLVRNH